MRGYKVRPSDFVPWRALDYDHMLSHSERLAVKTPEGFASPATRTSMLVWTDAGWLGGAPGALRECSRRGGVMTLDGTVARAGVDPHRRVIVYHVD